MTMSTMGSPRRATDTQIEIILNWRRNRRSCEDWGRIFGVSRYTVQCAVKQWHSPDLWITADKSRAGPGRKRLLTIPQVETLLDWHRTRKTRAQLARELGLSEWLVSEVIRRRGEYKRCSPEQHDALRAARRQKLQRLEALPSLRRSPDADDTWLRLRSQNKARFSAFLNSGSA